MRLAKDICEHFGHIVHCDPVSPEWNRMPLDRPVIAAEPLSVHSHAILHGESFDYDTRLNSCRSVSLLAYVAWILDKRLDGAA